MFTTVERPAKAYVDEEFIVALTETDVTGKAIQMTFDPITFGNWQANVRNRMAEVGYKVSYRKNCDTNTVVIWAIKA